MVSAVQVQTFSKCFLIKNNNLKILQILLNFFRQLNNSLLKDSDLKIRKIILEINFKSLLLVLNKLLNIINPTINVNDL